MMNDNNFHVRWSLFACPCGLKVTVYDPAKFTAPSKLQRDAMIKKMKKRAWRAGYRVLPALPEHCPKCGAVIVEEVKTMDAEGNIDGC